MLYLPSKTFIAIVFGMFFIVGGGYFVFFYESGIKNDGLGENKQREAESRKREAVSAALFANKDTDSDGLKDWEEVLWHTDQNNPDTDGDGTTDNEEILAKRDPAKAGPEDIIDASVASIVEGGKINKPVDPPETLTKQLAQQFGEAYLRQKFDKKEVDAQYLTKILFSDLTNTLAQPSTDLSKQKKTAYVEKQDLLVINDASPLAVKRYINQVGDVLVSSSLQEEKNEIQLVLDAVKEERLEDLQKLLAYRDSYQTTAKRLRETLVPSHLLNTHETMINSLWRLGLVAEEMSKFSEDPVGGLTAMNSYMAEAQRSVGPLKTIVAEIKKHHLTFREDESGTIFNRYLDIAI